MLQSHMPTLEKVEIFFGGCNVFLKKNVSLG